jgi:biotin carboxyl carrier protein
VIKSIAARLGERVTAGDPLLVIEAMKMDNVIRAPRKGTIAAIHVTEGGRVAHGDPLVTFAD